MGSRLLEAVIHLSQLLLKLDHLQNEHFVLRLRLELDSLGRDRLELSR